MVTSLSYDTACIRRGDFQEQFPGTDMGARDILAELLKEIPPGSQLFIATNERNISFYQLIQEVYSISFLGDFGEMLSNVSA